MVVNALTTPQQIADIVEGRDKALAHWMAARDSYHEHVEAAGASIAGYFALPVPADAGRYRDGEIALSFVGKDRAKFEAELTAVLDRRCWRALLERLGFDALLDRQAREEFEVSLREGPSPFTVENCRATFGTIWGDRRALMLRGIANTFSALDRRFRSHNGFKIGARLIINNAVNLDGWWSCYERRDTLHDVEKAFCDLDGRLPFDRHASPEAHNRRRHYVTDMRSWGIVQRISHALISKRRTPFVVHGHYFRARVFGNGNIHLWFERPDLLRKVNLLLAEHYGEVIGDGYNETEADEAPGYHVTPAKDFGAFFTSEAVANRVVEVAGLRSGMAVLEPSAGSGMLAKAARARGAEVTCVEIQPGLAHELGVLHRFADVVCSDFLRVEPADLGLFDAVVMNPPFDRGRDCDHVRHALRFLRPGGVLVAIMSARAEFGDDRRHKAFHRLVEECSPAYGNRPWWDLPAGSFAHAGTNVNTVILAIRKPAVALKEAA